MKQSILMLTVIGMMHFSADAQNNEAKKSDYDINYKVCRVDDKYRVCNNNTPNIVYTKPYIRKINKEYAKTIDGLRRYDQYVEVRPLPVVEVISKRRPIAYNQEFDGTSAAYHGNPTPENDGLAKNKERNINYLNSAVDLPSIDGKYASR